MKIVRKAALAVLSALCLAPAMAGCGQKDSAAPAAPSAPAALTPQQQQVQSQQAAGAAADAQRNAAARQAAGH